MPIPIEEISNIINDDTLITESTMHDHKMEIRTGWFLFEFRFSRLFFFSGNLFKTYGSALISAAALANSKIFKVIFFAMAAFSVTALLYAIVRVLLKYLCYIHLKKKENFTRRRGKRGLRSGTS